MASPDRLHRDVLWSGGLWLVSFPLMLFYLAIIGLIAQWLDVDFGSTEDATTELVLNVLYMAMVLGTLGVAAAIGFRGWRRHRLRLALVAAVLSLVTAVAFVLLPVLA